MGNVEVEEDILFKLRRMRRDGGTIISKVAHGNPTWTMHPPDEGGRLERVGTYHICGFLPPDTSVGEMPGARILHEST